MGRCHVPPTEKWLKKVRFLKEYDKEYYGNSEFNVRFGNQICKTIPTISSFKFIYEFQNLYKCEEILNNKPEIF